MPARPYRLAELHQHAVRSAAGQPPPDLRRALYQAARNGWPLCEAGCGWPVHPAALAPDFPPIHPSCEAQRWKTA